MAEEDTKSEVVKHVSRDRVQISLGKTINIGNFESYRVDVSYASDVRKAETLEAAYDRVMSSADQKLDGICAPIEDAMNKPAQKKGRQ